MTYNKEQLDNMRNVSLHSFFGMANTGRKVTVPCPFHNPAMKKENSASFWLFPDNGYKCFSCGKTGQNAIDFVKDVENVDFHGALSILIKYIT